MGQGVSANDAEFQFQHRSSTAQHAWQQHCSSMVPRSDTFFTYLPRSHSSAVHPSPGAHATPPPLPPPPAAAAAAAAASAAATPRAAVTISTAFGL